jgi:hypothetical protein
MEGIPAPDMAAYKRRKEEELGLASGTISQPPAKRPKMDYRQPTDAELAAQLAAHKALMAGNDVPSALAPTGPAVFGAPTAFAPPFPPPMGVFPPPPFAPGGAPIHLGSGPPPPFPPVGVIPPFPGGVMPPVAPGMPPPGVMVPPLGAPPAILGSVPPGASPPGPPGGTSLPPPAHSLPPPPQAPGSSQPPAPAAPAETKPSAEPASNYTNPPMKDGTALVYNDANQSPVRSCSFQHPHSLN